MDIAVVKRSRKLERYLAPWAAALVEQEMAKLPSSYVRSFEVAFRSTDDPDRFEMTVSAELDVSTPEGLRAYEEVEEWEASQQQQEAGC